MRRAGFLSPRIVVSAGALALLPLVLACRDRSTAERPAAGAAIEAAQRAIEKDLVLRGALKTPALIYAGEDVQVSLVLMQYESGQKLRGSRGGRRIGGGMAGTACLLYGHD